MGSQNLNETETVHENALWGSQSLNETETVHENALWEGMASTAIVILCPPRVIFLRKLSWFRSHLTWFLCKL